MILDFFLDEEENIQSPSLVGQIKTSAPPSTSSSANSNVDGVVDMSDLINAMRQLVSPDLVSKIKGVYHFHAPDAKPSNWYLDLRSGNGSVVVDKFDEKVNCKFASSAQVILDMANGKLKPTAAFMSGKLKITGDMAMAMKMEKMMSQMPQKLSAVNKEQPQAQTQSAQSGSGENKELLASLDKIKHLLSPELVQKTKGVYLFKISDSTPSDWCLDLKNGDGSLKEAEANQAANCTMTMTSDVFNKMVKGSLKPTAAFMSGKLKIKGDMGLAMKLEKIMSSLQSKL